MIKKINKSVPAWKFIFAFWMLLPQSTVGLVNNVSQPVQMSEQLLHKLEVMSKYRSQCENDSLCHVSKMNRIIGERKKDGIVALLAGFAVSR